MKPPRDIVLGPLPPLHDSNVRLALVSASILFTELLLIRWVPANIRYVGFFPNFLLMASFLGIGASILLVRRFEELPLSPFSLLLFVVVLLVATAQLNVHVSSGTELVFGLSINRQADVNFLVLPLVVVLATLLMAAVSLPLGRCSDRCHPCAPTPSISAGRWSGSARSRSCR